jgi:hypothetical protein
MRPVCESAECRPTPQNLACGAYGTVPIGTRQSARTGTKNIYLWRLSRGEPGASREAKKNTAEAVSMGTCMVRCQAGGLPRVTCPVEALRMIHA